MEQLNRMNRPAPVGGQVPVQAPAHQSGAPKKNKMKSRVALKVVAIVIVVVAILAGLGVYAMNNRGIASNIDTSKYQAVFLNSADGQVYFGKLTILDKDYYQLTDIYYVRVEQVQPDTNEQAQQNISLAKLGSEIHGPQDTMFINKDHVLFWENLKDDGQVVKAIVEYQNSQNQ
jgi:hypothetical protein